MRKIKDFSIEQLADLNDDPSMVDPPKEFAEGKEIGNGSEQHPDDGNSEQTVVEPTDAQPIETEAKAGGTQIGATGTPVGDEQGIISTDE